MIASALAALLAMATAASFDEDEDVDQANGSLMAPPKPGDELYIDLSTFEDYLPQLPPGVSPDVRATNPWWYQFYPPGVRINPHAPHPKPFDVGGWLPPKESSHCTSYPTPFLAKVRNGGEVVVPADATLEFVTGDHTEEVRAGELGLDIGGLVQCVNGRNVGRLISHSLRPREIVWRVKALAFSGLLISYNGLAMGANTVINVDDPEMLVMTRNRIDPPTFGGFAATLMRANGNLYMGMTLRRIEDSMAEVRDLGNPTLTLSRPGVVAVHFKGELGYVYWIHPHLNLSELQLGAGLTAGLGVGNYTYWDLSNDEVGAFDGFVPFRLLVLGRYRMLVLQLSYTVEPRFIQLAPVPVRIIADRGGAPGVFEFAVGLAF
jgi:hypothetical protein